MSSSSGPDAVLQSTGLLARYLRLTDANVHRFAKLLSTTAGLDSFLLTLTYTLHLVHATLQRAGTMQLQRAARDLVNQLTNKAPDALLPGEALIATIEQPPTSRILRTEQSVAALNGVLDEFRMFLRLRGLVNMWVWGSGVLRRPNADATLQRIAVVQVLACTVFQGLENWAYLAMKGVIGVQDKTRIGRAFLWSARMWMIHVALDFVRLARVRQLRLRRAAETGDEEKAKVTQAEIDTWWRELRVNAAWMPLTVHWSIQGGWASEAIVATLAGFAGWTGIIQAWKKTA